jgi:hypothetical protein
MELIQKTASIELTEKEALFVEQLAQGAWKTGGVRDPEDGRVLESLREKVKIAFAVPLPVEQKK